MDRPAVPPWGSSGLPAGASGYIRDTSGVVRGEGARKGKSVQSLPQSYYITLYPLVQHGIFPRLTTGDYRGLQGTTGDYRGLPGTTGDYRGLPGTAGVCYVILWHYLWYACDVHRCACRCVFLYRCLPLAACGAKDHPHRDR